METIVAIGAIQALFFSILLLKKNQGTICDKVLGMWLFIMFLHILANYLEFTGYYEKFPHLIGSTSSLIFLYGPLLYFYVDNYMSNSPGFRNEYFWHLVPFIAFNVILLPFYWQNAEYKLVYFQEVVRADPPWFLTIMTAAKAITVPVYVVWILFLLRRHRHNVRNYFSFTEKVDLHWISYLVWSIVALGGTIIILSVILAKYNFQQEFETEKLIFSAASLWILGLGYYGMRQTPIFMNERILEVMAEAPSEEKASAQSEYKKNRLKEFEVNNYRHKLESYMQEKKPFFKTQLTIDDLAQNLNIPAHNLSLFLNESIKVNFFDFVNSYRIDELKSRMGDPKYQHLTLLGIALECGFNSKASFNRVFKNHTGQTPSQYLKSQGSP